MSMLMAITMELSFFLKGRDNYCVLSNVFRCMLCFVNYV